MDYNRLLETGERCIYNEPAACTAWCPVHLDITQFVEELQKGDFHKAYQIMEKRIPLARIIGSICDHPCENVCVREKLDGAISVGELEKAAVQYGYSAVKKTLAVRQNTGRAAVIGGGISGIVAAMELNRKGFAVTIYEKTDRLGGRIWDYEGKTLKTEIIEEELQKITRMGILVHFNKTIEQLQLQEIKKEYDVVYLGTGNWEEGLKINPDTFQVEDSSLFAGGTLYHKRNSVIYSVSIGKRAAISMERYVKKISMTAARERESSFVTPLHYEMDDIEPMDRVEKTSAVYREEEAVKEAERCLKCRCIQCIKPCSHMKKFNINPKSYVRQINHNENVIMGTRYANKMINSCTLCGLCKEQCFLDISMKDIVSETRQSMVEKNKMPPSAHDFALKDMAFSNSDRFFMVKPPPPIPAEKRKERERELFTYPRITFSKYAQSIYKGDKPGTEKVDYLFYPGCQLSASSPEYVEKSYQYLLSKIKEGVGIMLGCCGAPADWAGRQDLMQENVDLFRKVWIEMGKPVFILACSSCAGIFEKYLGDIQYISLWEIFENYGLPPVEKKGENHALNIHDACSTRHNNKIHGSIRKIVSLLDYEIKELKYYKEKTKCCGYGGLVYYANREQAEDFVKDRTGESTEDMLVYCAMCKDLFVDGGKRTFHILDLIFGENLEKIALKKMPNLSERHKNRAGLKRRLLKELWGEETGMESTKISGTDLIILPEVWKLMEERYILEEDIQKVITHAKSTGERFYHSKDATYLARLKIENVTYWVKYEEKPDGILVSSVYSHRMEIVEE